MKKYLVYLLFIVVLPIVVSCSKDENTPELIIAESKISKETGISFMNASGFEADRVVFKLKSGSGPEKEYGQSLEGYNITELHAGSKTIYQLYVYKNGAEIPYNAYTIAGEGNQKEINPTSVIVVEDNQVFEIVLEGTD